MYVSFLDSLSFIFFSALFLTHPYVHQYDIAAKAKIIGSQELHIKKGSTISLTCTVNIYGSAISW